MSRLLPRLADDGARASHRSADPILMYHDVAVERGRRFRPFVVTPSSFEAQMAFLAAHHYRVVSISQLVGERRNNSRTLEERVVAVTFDDAFRALLEHALPVLERLGFGATVYVPTAFIGDTSRWLQGIGEGARPVMCSDDLRGLDAIGIEVGAHSHTHPALDVVGHDEAKMQVEVSKQILEGTIGQEVKTFAYPFGYESASVRRVVAEAGYASACRVNYSLSPREEDVYALSRLPIYGDCDLVQFAAIVEGRARMRYERARAAAWHPFRRALGRAQEHRRGG